MKKELNKIIIFTGMTLALIGLFICNFDLSLVWKSSASGDLLIAGLASCFVFAKNNTLKNVGYMLCLYVGVLGVSYFNYGGVASVVGVGFVAMLIGAVCYFIKIILMFFGFSKGGVAHRSTNLIESLIKLKEMQTEEVLSAEEYDSLKAAALEDGIGQKTTLEDLKKWKKMLDQKIITEDEFASLKAKAFNK